MNEELQAAVAGLISKTLNAAEKGVDFLEGQLPDYIMQLLMWHGIYSFVQFIIGVVIVYLSWAGPTILLSKKQRDRWNSSRRHDPPWQLLYIISGLITILMLITSINLVWLQIWIAPKVWLVEYAANLVK